MGRIWLGATWRCPRMLQTLKRTGCGRDEKVVVGTFIASHRAPETPATSVCFCLPLALHPATRSQDPHIDQTSNSGTFRCPAYIFLFVSTDNARSSLVSYDHKDLSRARVPSYLVLAWAVFEFCRARFRAFSPYHPDVHTARPGHWT